MDPQAPGTTAPPPGAPTSPPPYRPPFETSGRKLRRSSSNRVIAGIAGGLAEYLGVDATPLRVVFVVVSCLFLGGGGGVVLYLLLWAIVPQAGAPAGSRRASSGRPWHDWDRPARSWAIVLGSLTLALIWSFGLGPGLHWSALPVLLLIGGLTVWLISRRRPGYWGGPGSHPAGPAYPYSGPGPYPGPGTEPSTWPDGGPYPGTGPSTTTSASYAPSYAAPGPAEPPSPYTPGPTPAPDTQAAADWAQAQSAAAGWASEQLAVAGVPPRSATVLRSPRRQRHRLAPLAVAITGIVLAFTVMTVVLTLATGSSLRGGVGDSHYAPMSVGDVQPSYRLGIGELDVDLSQVKFPPQVRKPFNISMSLGIGHLLVVVPAGATVFVNASAGLGRVNVGDASGSQFQGPLGGEKAKGGRTGALRIDAHVGMGELDVKRA